jgi:hypothetical protein
MHTAWSSHFLAGHRVATLLQVSARCRWPEASGQVGQVEQAETGQHEVVNDAADFVCLPVNEVVGRGSLIGNPLRATIP